MPMTPLDLLLVALDRTVPVALFVTLAADVVVRRVSRRRAVQCAWCRRTVTSGRRPVTHTCCPRCYRAAMAAADQV